MNLKSEGRIRVLRALHEVGALSRTDLVLRTGLSRATVASLVSELIDAGVIGEDEDSASVPGIRTGRPARVLRIVGSVTHVIGVDIGHAHIGVLVCDVSGRPLWTRRVAQVIDLPAGSTLDAVADLVRQALDDTGLSLADVLGVGIAIASPVLAQAQQVAGPGIMPGWLEVRPAAELTLRTGLPAVMINDANAGAIAEHIAGAGLGSSDMIYVRLGEGIGAGIVSGGRLVLGSRGLAGEIGHLPIVDDGLVCRCGNRGCLETVATPTSIARLLSQSRGQTILPEHLPGLVADGNRGARRAVLDAARAVGRALSSMVALFDPAVIVVGGDLALAGELVLDSLREELAERAMPWEPLPEVRPAALLGAAEMRGAAAVVLEQVPQALMGLTGRDRVVSG